MNKPVIYVQRSNGGVLPVWKFAWDGEYWSHTTRYGRRYVLAFVNSERGQWHYIAYHTQTSFGWADYTRDIHATRVEFPDGGTYCFPGKCNRDNCPKETP